MNRQSLKKQLWVIIFTLITSISFGQTFEGWINYKLEAFNPNTEMIPDSLWQQLMKEQFGEDGYMVQKYFYKGDKYISEIDAGKQSGYQAYNSKDKLIYTWQANSDTTITVDSRKNMDEFLEITDGDNSDTILGIPCKSIIVKSKMGKMVLWYNDNYLKMDVTQFKGHLYGHWEQILKRIGCLPLKMEQKGFMTHIVQTATAFKDEKIEDSKFKIPEFKTVIENPMN